jgi:PAS domain S-box-containing protein
MEPRGGRASWVGRRLAPTLIVCLLLLVLEAGFVPAAAARWVSNLLQLALSVAAAAACLRTGAREQGLGRPFFALIGIGMALWAAAQAVLALTDASSPPRPLVAVQDFFFVASLAPVVAACALRPDRPRAGALGLAADFGLVCVLTLFLHAYFASSIQMLGGADVGPQSAVFLNPLRPLALGGLLWLLHGSEGSWRRLYEALALALVVFVGLGVLPNLTLSAGTYRPGLQDLPWTLPFLWVALAAGGWRLQPARAQTVPALDPEAGWQAEIWRETRHGSVIALGAAILVPAVHELAMVVNPPAAELADLRSGIALVATLLVGGSYLARQLHILRRAEHTQGEREERFRALVENSPDAIGVVDTAGRFTYLSASTERVTGYRPEELAGRSSLALVHPDEVEAVGRFQRDVLARPGAVARRLVRFRHRDGAVRHVAIDAVNQVDTPGVAGMVLHVRDVTETRRAEAERERSLSLLEATLESTADGILVVDREGRIARFNQKFAAMWGIPAEVLASGDDGKAIEHVLGQLVEPEVFLDRVRRLYAEPEGESFEVLRFRDGRVFERYSQPQRLGGEAVGRVWSFRDVTERAHAEEAMARLGAIVEATPDFVATGDASLRTLYVNRAGRRMLGLGEGDALGGRHLGGFHPPGAAGNLVEEAVPTAFREGVWSGESVLRHEDGREIPVLQVLLAHRSPGGEVDFVSTIARDISERIEAEHELRRGHTLAALGALVAGVAHEVRNPLFGISSTLDVFEARFAGREDHRTYVRVLREQIERLTGLMNDLLEYAKPTHLELKRGRLEDVVVQAMSACAALRERTGAEIETQIAPDLPLVPMDAGRLGQVFRNLLENALQHAPAGGRVRVEARLVHDRGATWVECVIEDDGPGIGEEDLPHLFEPFFTRRRGGTGLGLSIVHRIVTDHGGSITARNRPRGGARFTLTLRATPESAR